MLVGVFVDPQDFQGRIEAEVGAVSAAVEVPVIASGGVGSLEHFADGVLRGRADAVLAPSVFHFGEFSVREAKAHMRSRGIEVRL